MKLKFLSIPIAILLVIILSLPSVAAVGPNVQVVGTPTFSEVSPGKIKLTITLHNYGDQVAPSFIFELQALGVASFTTISPTEKVCDPSHPENVHVTVPSIGPGGEYTFSINSPYSDPTLPGKTLPRAIYNIYGASFSNCCVNGASCTAVQPFGGSPNYGVKLLGQLNVQGVTNPTPIVCGNSVCEATEWVGNCAKDCPGFCGDAYCNAAKETSTSCSSDCGAVVICNNNNQCEPSRGENNANCAHDCTVTDPCLGANPPSTCGTDPNSIGGLNITMIAGIAVIGVGGYMLLKRR